MGRRAGNAVLKLGLALLVTALLLVAFGGAGLAQDSLVERIDGLDRYQTSAEVAREAYDSAETVLLARGDDEGEFADGLAAGVLAGAVDGPILLTEPENLPGEIEEVIEELEANQAYVLGGGAAVSEEVEADLEDKGLEMERLAGDNQYALKIIS